MSEQTSKPCLKHEIVWSRTCPHCEIERLERLVALREHEIRMQYDNPKEWNCQCGKPWMEHECPRAADETDCGCSSGKWFCLGVLAGASIVMLAWAASLL
jgi:hypothetical protein